MNIRIPSLVSERSLASIRVVTYSLVIALILSGFTFVFTPNLHASSSSDAPTDFPYFKNRKNLPCKSVITAHRGTIGKTENTVPGIRRAFKLGADAVEIDVRKTKDNVFVLMHDADVRRTTNGRGKIKDMTFEQVQLLRVKDNIRVPTLRKALEVVSQYGKGNRTVQLDIKRMGLNHTDLDALMQLVDRYEMRERVIVASAWPTTLELFNTHAPSIPTGSIQPTGVWPNLRTLPHHIDTVNVHWEEATRIRIRHATVRHFGVLARSINSERLAKQAIRNGVLVIVTDNPRAAIAACRNK